ncbi:MAG: iron-containing alcohol dehydrogenase [Deltaproteobacteria bacterium]|nr:MAG: iron-containing alcohol dehydrogenase [Deltaproteobacteria bacterium]
MAFSDFFQFYCPTKLVFQPGISKDFSAELAHFSLTKVQVITDAMLVKVGLVAPIVEGLKNAGIEVVSIFDRVPPNSELKIIQECADEAIQKEVDGIIAIGGGSVIDTAKCVDILLTYGGDLVNDYSGAETLSGPLKPLIAIPTTSGTGSEVTHAAVILDASTHTKLSFVDRNLAPHMAILDPELTFGLPAKLTAATAMDALTHAIESMTSIQTNPISTALAMQVIPLIRQNILKAVLNGQDLEARSALMTAATLAGIAFDHSMVGVVHGMSHAAGGLAGIHHGLANSIFLPWGMDYNFEKCVETYAKVATLLGIKREGLSETDLARQGIESIKKLRAELKQACGMAENLSEAGVSQDLLEAITEGAVNDGTSFYNPREVVKEDLLPFVQKAFK